MAERKALKCKSCGEQFLRTEMVQYCSPKANNPLWYCKKCLAEKQAREKFSDQVCKIFGLKAPGPRIWTERKRIIETYGYTDQILIDCLDYIYNVEHKRKLAESLCLVKPPMVDKMMQYKRQLTEVGDSLVQAAQTEMKEYVVPMRQTKTASKRILNPDDFLF